MRKLSMIAAFALVCGLTLPASFAFAEAPKGPTPGAAVVNSFGPAGNTFPEGAFAVVVNYSFADKDNWYDGGHSHSAKHGNSNVQNIGALKLRYGLGNGWDLRTTTPFMSMDFEQGQDKCGVADSMLILRRQWFSQDDGYLVSFGAGLGLQIPTGSTDKNGLGSGAWGLMPEMGVSYRFDNKRQLVEGGMNYIWRGKNEDSDVDIDAVDALRIHARYVYALDKNWDLGLETQYEHIFEGKKDGHGMGNSCSTWFAGPAVTYKIPAWKMSIGASAQVSLYQDYEARAGLGEDCRFEMKLVKSF